MTGILSSAPATRTVDTSVAMDKIPEWFPGARLNYAENLLRWARRRRNVVESSSYFRDEDSSKTLYKCLTFSKVHIVSERAYSCPRLTVTMLCCRYHDDSAIALHYTSERLGADGVKTKTFGQLRDSVRRLAASLARAGVEAGDRVVGYIPNCPEAVEVSLVCLECLVIV